MSEYLINYRCGRDFWNDLASMVKTFLLSNSTSTDRSATVATAAELHWASHRPIDWSTWAKLFPKLS